MESWTDRAREIIAQQRLECGSDDPVEQMAYCRKYYPFFERKYWPYKCWLRAMNEAFKTKSLQRDSRGRVFSDTKSGDLFV